LEAVALNKTRKRNVEKWKERKNEEEDECYLRLEVRFAGWRIL
jgi:hypothetical protein